MIRSQWKTVLAFNRMAQRIATADAHKTEWLLGAGVVGEGMETQHSPCPPAPALERCSPKSKSFCSFKSPRILFLTSYTLLRLFSTPRILTSPLDKVPAHVLTVLSNGLSIPPRLPPTFHLHSKACSWLLSHFSNIPFQFLLWLWVYPRGGPLTCFLLPASLTTPPAAPSPRDLPPPLRSTRFTSLGVGWTSPRNVPL